MSIMNVHNQSGNVNMLLSNIFIFKNNLLKIICNTWSYIEVTFLFVLYRPTTWSNLHFHISVIIRVFETTFFSPVFTVNFNYNTFIEQNDRINVSKNIYRWINNTIYFIWYILCIKYYYFHVKNIYRPNECKKIGNVYDNTKLENEKII